MGDLEKRYPNISALQFFLSGNPKELNPAPLENQVIPAGTEVVYVYGLRENLGDIATWLDSGKERDLVFLEDDPDTVQSFITAGKDRIFTHERIHLKIKLPTDTWDDFYESIAREFPVDHIWVIDGKSDEPTFAAIRENLLRRSVMENAIHMENLHYPKLIDNIRRNFQTLSFGFDVGKWKERFEGMPAILCGAGPSLAGAKDQLHKAKNRAIFFAGGSSIMALNAIGLDPDLAFAFDPNHEEYVRLRHNFSFKVPLITGARVQPDIERFVSGPRGYFPTGTGGLFEEYMERKLKIEDHNVLADLSPEAMSVTTVALMSAIYMGCDPIILVGVDLCYRGNERYSEGVLPTQQTSLESAAKVADQLIEKDGVTYVAKWLMERDVLDDLAGKYDDRTFVDGTCKGVDFSNIPKERDFLRLLGNMSDVEGSIHEAICDTRFEFSKESIEAAVQPMRESLVRCQECIKEVSKELEEGGVEETPRMIAFEYDLQEEIAYQTLLHAPIYAYTYQLKRDLRLPDEENVSFQIKQKLYRKLNQIVTDLALL